MLERILAIVFGLALIAVMAVWLSSRTEQRGHERRIADAMLIIAIGSSVIALLTGVATQGQLDAMQLGQRPWIALASASHAEFLGYQNQGPDRLAKATVLIKLRNVGNLPALDYRLHVIPLVWVEGTTPVLWKKKQTDVCKKALDLFSRNEGENIVLLPGEESIPYHYDFVDKNQFGDFAIHVGEAQRYTVIFVGCATYKSPTDSATHQSGVVFTMIGDKAPIDPQRDHQIDTSEPLPKVEIIRDYTAGPAN